MQSLETEHTTVTLFIIFLNIWPVFLDVFIRQILMQVLEVDTGGTQQLLHMLGRRNVQTDRLQHVCKSSVCILVMDRTWIFWLICSFSQAVRVMLRCWCFAKEAQPVLDSHVGWGVCLCKLWLEQCYQTHEPTDNCEQKNEHKKHDGVFSPLLMR